MKRKIFIWFFLLIFFICFYILNSMINQRVEAGALTKERLVPEIKFLYPAPKFQLNNYETGTMIAKNWEKLGIKVNVTLTPSYPIFESMAAPPKSDFDAGIHRLTATPDRLDPDVLLFSQYHSKAGARRSYAGYTNPEMDKLLEAQREEIDIQKRKELLYRIQEILYRDIPSIVLYHPDDIFIYNKRNWSNFTSMPGQGVASIWAALDATPLTRDKSLKMGATTPLENFNPLNVTISRTAWNYIMYWFDTLTRIGPKVDIRPWIAESWKWIDNTTIDVKIRSGMKFHDGKPLTVEDVKFTYEFYKKWKQPFVINLVNLISDIKIQSENTLRMKLEKPFPALPFIAFSEVPILPRHIWSDITAQKGLKHPGDWVEDPKITIGSGPFKFSSWKRGEFLRLKRNDEHFNPPKSEQFIYVDFGSPESLFLALKKEDIDFHCYRVVMTLANAEEAEKVKHLKAEFVPTFAVNQLVFNLRKLPFKDSSFRRAISHTIPFDAIVRDLLGGHGKPGVSDIAPSNSEWHNPRLKAYEYNLDLARKILKDAGYEWDSEGKLYLPERLIK